MFHTCAIRFYVTANLEKNYNFFGNVVWACLGFWPLPFGHQQPQQQAPAHARQPVVLVGFGAAIMMVMRRIPSEMRCNDKGISPPSVRRDVSCKLMMCFALSTSIIFFLTSFFSPSFDKRLYDQMMMDHVKYRVWSFSLYPVTFHACSLQDRYLLGHS